ncbi:MAG: hypothetical protein QOJ65_218 [Fimbriimonadaceae bacterium]|jgi:hypothetical protein|nr:hypothetical protein [Fimbriimonadaceae bacterium]
MKFLGILGLGLAACVVHASSVAHVSFVRNGVRYHAVVVDLSAGDLAVKTVMADGSRSAWKMIGTQQPVAAITGTFFSVSHSTPVADVLVNGDLKAKGNRGSGLAIDYFGQVSIFDEHFLRKTEWSMFQYGLRGAVRVVSDGRVNPDPKSQRFKDRAIWGRAARTGIGLTKSGKLVLFATGKPVTLSQFGRAMVSFGVKNGISLDGGSSTCLYYNGEMLLSPRRRLTNLLVVTPKSTVASMQTVAQSHPAETTEKITSLETVRGATSEPGSGGKQR